MIAPVVLTLLLCGVLVYAWSAYRRTPVVSVLALLTGALGFYFVWHPDDATRLAELVGIGRGADLVLYVWVVLSFIAVLYLHLRMRAQAELITGLARAIAIQHPAGPLARPDAR